MPANVERATNSLFIADIAKSNGIGAHTTTAKGAGVF